MTPAPELLAHLPASLAGHALSVAALALAVALATRLIRHPAVRHALWLAVLLRLLVPNALVLPLLPAWWPALPSATWQATPSPTPSPTASPAAIGAPATAPIAIAPPAATPSAPDDRGALGLALLAMLLAGSLAVAGLAAVRIVRFRHRFDSALPAPAWLEARAAALAARLALARAPAVRVLDEAISPALWPRFGGAALLLPARLVATLERAQLDAILVHELAHLRRRDHWVRAVELVATIACWWHPCTWWARRQLRRAEERACDAWVAHVLPGQGRAYAESLLRTLEMLTRRRAPLPILATGIAPRADLEERLTMIATDQSPRLLSTVQRGLLAAAAIALILILPSRSTHGDDQTPADEGSAGTITGVDIATDPADRRAFEDRFRAIEDQAQALEEQALALEDRRRALEAKRRELEREHETLARQAARMEVAAEAERLEAAGQAEEAEALRLQLEAMELEAEVARKTYAVEREMREREQAIERELRAQERAMRDQAREAEDRARAMAEEMERLHHEREEAMRAGMRAERRAQAAALGAEIARVERDLETADDDQRPHLEEALEALRTDRERLERELEP